MIDSCSPSKLDPGFAANPYPHYAALRSTAPVFSTGVGPWLLTRYDDVVRVLRDPTMSVEARDTSAFPLPPEMIERIGDRSRGSRSMLSLDPPDHDRLRRLVAKTFTPKTVAQLAPLCDRLVATALDDAEARGSMDVIADLAFLLPFTVISEMLGMPMDRRDDLRVWSGALVKTLDPVFTMEEFEAALDGGDAMTAYVNVVIDEKRARPTDDLLSALIAAEDQGDMLDEQELIDQVILLYVAGHSASCTATDSVVRYRRRVHGRSDQAAQQRAPPDPHQSADHRGRRRRGVGGGRWAGAAGTRAV